MAVVGCSLDPSPMTATLTLAIQLAYAAAMLTRGSCKQLPFVCMAVDDGTRDCCGSASTVELHSHVFGLLLLCAHRMHAMHDGGTCGFGASYFHHDVRHLSTYTGTGITVMQHSNNDQLLNAAANQMLASYSSQPSTSCGTVVSKYITPCSSFLTATCSHQSTAHIEQHFTDIKNMMQVHKWSR